MHRAVAEKLRCDPRIAERARERVREWRRTGEVHEAYIDGWERLLGMPIGELCKMLVDPSEPMRALRQVSVFAGALGSRERWRFYKVRM
jgi:hypothetical protein